MEVLADLECDLDLFFQWRRDVFGEHMLRFVLRCERFEIGVASCRRNCDFNSSFFQCFRKNRRRIAAIDGGDTRSGLRKRQRDGTSDAPCSTGNQNVFAREINLHF